MAKLDDGHKRIAENRKARHEYKIDDVFEAGIMLTGTEVKSLRNGKASIKEAYARVKNGEVFLEGMNITPYEQGNRYNHEETRTRKLLLNHKEIAEIHVQATQRRWTTVPLQMYINEHGRAKVQIAVVRGKQQHDKRDTVAKRDSDRDLRRALKGDY